VNIRSNHENLVKCAENLVDYWKDKYNSVGREDSREYARKGWTIERMRRGAVIWKIVRDPLDPEKYYLPLDRSESAYEWRAFIKDAFKLFGHKLLNAVIALDSTPPPEHHLISSEEHHKACVTHIIDCANRCRAGHSLEINETVAVRLGVHYPPLKKKTRKLS